MAILRREQIRAGTDRPLRTLIGEPRSRLERCKGLVIPGLRDDLLAAESSFEALLPGRCDAEAEGADDKSLQNFSRSRCLIAALSDNTRGMLDAHPECAAP
jgi:hypothetical protein